MLNKLDKVLHDQIHSSMMSKDPKTLLDNPRLQILDKLYDNYKLKIEGVIADVGCGSGYFGIGLAKKFPNVSRVDCIEASVKAVKELIPRNINFYNLEKRVKPVLGSFDNLEDETYDIIFAMGALHHSQNLKNTFKSLHNALKPSGLLIAQEPAMPDETKHNDYQFKYNIVEERYGTKIRNGDRYDRFFRECEYKYCLIINGFDILYWENFNRNSKKNSKLGSVKKYIDKNGYKNTFFKIINRLFRTKNKTSQTINWKKDMEKATANLSSKLFIAKKSDCENVFHDKLF